MSGDELRSNLPVRLTSFVGREHELAEVARLLDVARLVTLVGAPGVGKTRLALQVAHELRNRFVDGAGFVELASLAEPSFVPDAVAATLGVQQRPDRPLVDTLAEHLEARHVLLVLDNCEHLLTACATLVEQLLQSAPGLVVLATSREALRAEGEITWRVPSLSTPGAEYRVQTGADAVTDLSRFEAARLFVDRARAALPAFTLTSQDAPAVVTICHRLDGIPLAIELAAARVSALAPVEIAARLDGHLALLHGGRRTALPRQQTLRGAIDWSYELLTEEERTLLRRLAVFAGGWVLPAAEAVCDSQDADGRARDTVLDLLVSLVGKSLVQVDAGTGAERRYRLLEMIRQYGLEKLRESGEEIAIRRRQLAWYVDLAPRSRAGMTGPDSVAWAGRLTAELDNARAALTWSLDDSAGASVHLGMRVAYGFFYLWLFRDLLLEGWHWLERLLTKDQAKGDDAPDGSSVSLSRGVKQRTLPNTPVSMSGSHLRVLALLDLTTLAQQLGRLGRGEEAAQEALALARSVHDRHGEATALSILGNTARAAGQYDRAVRLLAETLPIFRQLGDRGWIVHGLLNLGETVGHQGDFDRARPLLEEGLALAREDGAPWQIGFALKNLGVVVYRQGDLDRGQMLLEESLVVFEQMRATRGLSWSNWDLGHLCLARGEPERAARYFAESFRLCREAGDRLGMPRCLEGLAAAAAMAANGAPGPLATYAAQLLGLAATQRAASGIQVPPVQRPAVERAIAAARALLGDETYAAAFAAGREMPLDRMAEIGLDLARSSVADGSMEPATTTNSQPATDAWSPLTVREREVAALVAAGLTNRQIAARLVISDRTVQGHIASILTRLDFDTRSQIAAWAARRESSASLEG